MLFQFLLFILISFFYGTYFIKQLLLRKKGIATNRLAKGSKPKKTVMIETCLLFATYGTATIQYASIFLSKYMVAFSLPTGVRSIGLILTGTGVLCFLLAITSMKDSWRAGVDEQQKTTLVTKGIYQFSRNPAFLGFDLLYIGTVLVVPDVIMTLAAIISLGSLHQQILAEENYLSHTFGVAYRHYLQKTPRYVLFF